MWLKSSLFDKKTNKDWICKLVWWLFWTFNTQFSEFSKTVSGIAYGYGSSYNLNGKKKKNPDVELYVFTPGCISRQKKRARERYIALASERASETEREREREKYLHSITEWRQHLLLRRIHQLNLHPRSPKTISR